MGPSTSTVVLVDDGLALAVPARAYRDWRGVLGLPDLAERQARTLLPESAGGRAAADTVPGFGPGE